MSPHARRSAAQLVYSRQPAPLAFKKSLLGAMLEDKRFPRQGCQWRLAVSALYAPFCSGAVSRWIRDLIAN